MKINSSHIGFAVILLVSGFVFFALQKSKPIMTSDAPVDTAALSATDNPAGGTASIWIESHEIDLGLVHNYDKTYSKMRVENRGKQNLKIIKINTTCLCTQGRIDPNKATIPPGGFAEIEIQLDPMRIGGFTSTKTLTILSNDVQKPQIQVKVSAHVTPEFELLPEDLLNFNTIQQGESPKITCLLRQLNDEPLEIREIMENLPKKGAAAKPDSGIFKYTYVLRPEQSWLTPGKTEYDVTVQVSPNAKPGLHKTYFFLILNLKRARLTRSQVTVTIV